MNQNPHPAGPAGGATPPALKPPQGVPVATTFAAPGIDHGPPAPAWFLFATLGLALLAALTLGQKPVGLGLAITGAALAIIVAKAIPERPRFSTACLCAAALLALTPALRAAEWVQLIALTSALLLASIGAARASTWRELAAANWAWIPNVVWAPAQLLTDAVRRSAHKRWGQLGPVLRGVVLAVVLLSVFGALFASADAAFAHLTTHLVDWHPTPKTFVIDAVIFVLVVALAGGLRRVAVARPERPTRPATRSLGTIEWVIALGALVALFAAFVAFQLATLFGGDDHVLHTAGLTYAEYARSGFGQLAFAAVLTLAVVAGATRYGPAGSRALRGLLAALCVLTVVLLASALHRLGLYEDAYGATRLRFLVHVSLWWLGAVFVAVLLAGAVHRTRALPRALVLLCAATSIAFVAVNPDGRVAQRNIERAAAGHSLDTWYLTSLSADAVPSLHSLPSKVAACLATSFAGQLDDHEHVASLNVGRARARARFAALGAKPALSGCDASYP